MALSIQDAEPELLAHQADKMHVPKKVQDRREAWNPTFFCCFSALLRAVLRASVRGEFKATVPYAFMQQIFALWVISPTEYYPARIASEESSPLPTRLQCVSSPSLILLAHSEYLIIPKQCPSLQWCSLMGYAHKSK